MNELTQEQKDIMEIVFQVVEELDGAGLVITDEDEVRDGIENMSNFILNELEGNTSDLLKALEGLFENCSMIHNRWGEGSNVKEADEAIAFARAVMERAKGV